MKSRKHKQSPPQMQTEASDKRLIGYARVSTEDQTLDLQIDALARAGVTPDRMHVEKVSAASKRRPALDLALISARKGDVLVIWKLDRLGRDARELLTQVKRLEDRGIALRSLTDGLEPTTSSGRMMLTMLAAVAQFERDQIRDRVRAGMRAHLERGGKVGRAPKLTQAQIEEGRRMRAAGASKSAIARHLGCAPATVASWVCNDRVPKNRPKP